MHVLVRVSSAMEHQDQSKFIIEGSQNRDLEAAADTEARERCCSLVCSS